jgi:hypothetical protein
VGFGIAGVIMGYLACQGLRLARKATLLTRKPLGCLFRGKFVAYLKEAFAEGRLDSTDNFANWPIRPALRIPNAPGR